MTEEHRPTPPRPAFWRLLLAMALGPLLAWLTMGTEGVLALALPHALLGALLFVSRLAVWRAAAIAAVAGGGLGAVFTAMTHAPAERRYLAAFVLFASLLAPIGAAIGTYRQGYRRLGKIVLIVLALLLILVLLVILTHPGDEAVPADIEPDAAVRPSLSTAEEWHARSSTCGGMHDCPSDSKCRLLTRATTADGSARCTRMTTRRIPSDFLTPTLQGSQS